MKHRGFKLFLNILLILCLVLGACIGSGVIVMKAVGYALSHSCDLSERGFIPTPNHYSVTYGEQIVADIAYDPDIQLLVVSDPDTGDIQILEYVTMLDHYMVTTTENDVVIMYTDIEICWGKLWVHQHRPRMDGEGSS